MKIKNVFLLAIFTVIMPIYVMSGDVESRSGWFNVSNLGARIVGSLGLSKEYERLQRVIVEQSRIITNLEKELAAKDLFIQEHCFVGLHKEKGVHVPSMHQVDINWSGMVASLSDYAIVERIHEYAADLQLYGTLDKDRARELVALIDRLRTLRKNPALYEREYVQAERLAGFAGILRK